jgi:hypothetical protein
MARLAATLVAGVSVPVGVWSCDTEPGPAVPGVAPGSAQPVTVSAAVSSTPGSRSFTRRVTLMPC